MQRDNETERGRGREGGKEGGRREREKERETEGILGIMECKNSRGEREQQK